MRRPLTDRGFAALRVGIWAEFRDRVHSPASLLLVDGRDGKGAGLEVSTVSYIPRFITRPRLKGVRQRRRWDPDHKHPSPHLESKVQCKGEGGLDCRLPAHRG